MYYMYICAILSFVFGDTSVMQKVMMTYIAVLGDVAASGC